VSEHARPSQAPADYAVPPAITAAVPAPSSW
jgi:hypothetical protein